MYSRVAHRSLLRIVIALTTCTGLVTISSVPLLVTGAAQGQRDASESKATPRPSKPEGVWPNLGNVKHESPRETNAPPPIPSTLRSQKNSGRPWDGRRVGDPDPQGMLDHRTERGSAGSNLASNPKLINERRSNQTRRAHASPRMITPPPVTDNQFVQNFFTWALTVSPSAEETTYWNDQLRVAYTQGQSSLKLAAIELGRTLFESATYAERNRDAHWYVYDLYKTYLMREPDAGGWATWELLVPSHGREYVRRGFEESGEFATLIANITVSGSPTANASLISARVDPRNQPGSGMLTRDTNWSVPLLSLPGRAGLDLGLTLSYSSMVWTRSGPYMYFDEDNGFPSPGFRLGFPTVQRKVFDAQTAKNAYLMITAAGRRVELRHVSSNTYDAGDSSYLRLTEDGATLRVHSTDGTRLSFTEANGEYRCREVKDRNGNYITIDYNSLGQITTITDTLGRLITFNYDSYANPLSITQAWGAQTHEWATFGWASHTMQSSFGTLRVIGPANNAALPVLKQVGLPDGNRYEFEYTNPGQVSVIRRYRTDNTQPFYTVFQYQSTTTDCPRLSQTRVAAENWTSLNGVPGEVTTYFEVDPDGACRMTAPDGTVYKEYYGTGWQKGLTTLSEVWSSGVKKKWITTAWTQDNTSVGYEVNPRITETNVYDGSNRRRTEIDYGPYAQYGLPYMVREYAADAVTRIRETFTDYNLSQAFLDRRIIGLVSEVHVTNISSFQTKLVYSYDNPSQLQPLPAAATQHDSSYSTSFTTRGNLTAVARWDVTDIVNPAKALTTQMRYNTTGSVIATIDPAGHENTVSYTDSFSDDINRNTFAYPTTLTDAGSFSSNVKYNFNFGGKTRTEGPPPAEQPQGAIQTITYDNIGRMERITTVNNGAYTRYVYGPNFVQSFSTVNNVADEAYNIQVVDGVGRVIGSAGNHPGSTGGYRAQMTIYDLMGRAVKTSNPTEITGAWVPAGDDVAGWLYTQQTYDWQGRPLRTTHPDTTYREAFYTGCGCAGGEVVTLTDEGTIDAGVAKRRQQKIYSDVLGRTVKTEVLNWQGGSVYSTTVNTYNMRDQVTQVRQWAGAEGGGAYQDTTMTYDGYGRLKTRHNPEHNTGTATTWDYNSDDTIQKITDARGASQTFGYNNRHLRTSITYAVPSGSGITVPAQATFGYDAAGNRTSMTDGSGVQTYHYDQLSRMDWEERTFSGLSGTYRLSYGYNLLNQLITLAEPTQFGATFSSIYDVSGQLTSVNGSAFAGVSNYASNLQYRAWGGLKHMNYGNSKTLDATYNARLQVAGFIIPGVISKTYQYYADSSLRFSSDSTNHKWDRFYSYDHTARIKEAFSGAEARFEPQTSNRPYRQTFSYDSFNHITARLSLNWSSDYSTSNTYTNNRRVSWSYDAGGNLLSNSEITYTYDAGGRIRTVETLEPFGATVRGLDGDGKQVKTEHVSYDEQTQSNVTKIVYYLRSSVLGGQVLTEIESSGTKKRTFVYAGNEVLAWHVYYGVNPGVVWEHQDPSQASFRTTDVVGQSIGHSPDEDPAELDPLRADAGLAAPLIEPVPPEDRNDSLVSYPGFSDPARSNFIYRVDGIPVSADYFTIQLDFAFHGSLGLLDATKPRFAGYSVRLGGNGAEYNYGSDELTAISAAQEFGNNTLFQNWFVSDGWFQSVSLRSPEPSTPNPQNPGALPLGDDQLKKSINEMSSSCRTAMQKLLSQIAAQTGTEFTSTDPVTLFSQITSQKGGGGIYVNITTGNMKDRLPADAMRVYRPVAGGSGVAWYFGSASEKSVQRIAVIFLRYTDGTAKSVGLAMSAYFVTAIHEMVHIARKDNRYIEHAQMDRAARSLRAFSFDNYVEKNCIQKQYRGRP